MKNFLLVCNLKANSIDEKLYKEEMQNDVFCNLILCPNFCDIKSYCKLKETNKIFVGAQDVSEFENGAKTGEITAEILKSSGADFCIVGHSERKRFNFETLSQTNKKIKMLLAYGVTPIVCVGEEKYIEDDQTGYAERYVLSELSQCLQDVDISQIIVAYEPIWAIGTGKIATISHIEKIVSSIKKYTGVSMVLYGGSYNESNFEDISIIKDLDGALIGGASLKPKSICNIQRRLKEIL